MFIIIIYMCNETWIAQMVEYPARVRKILGSNVVQVITSNYI